MTTAPISLHALLADWPYAREYLLSSMDGQLIEKHALLHLSRALNIGSVVGFLSAGVSMTYGRISWRQLLVELVDEVTLDFEALKEAYNGAPPERLARLFDSLQDLNILARPIGQAIPTDRFPAVFQLCEELSSATAQDPTLKLHRRRHNLEAPQPFEARVQLRTRDGHYYPISLLAQCLKKSPEDDLTMALDRLKRTWSNFNPLTRQQLFSFPNIIDFLFANLATLESQYASVLQAWGVKQGTQNTTPKPSLRFVAVAVMASSFDHDARNQLAKCIMTYSEAIPKADQVSELKRSLPIAPAADILGTLQTRLGINRYVTTNYDVELERLIHDHSGTKQEPKRINLAAETVDALGRTSRDFVVRGDASAELADFAVSTTRHKLDVAHLHGRSLPGEPIVATESAYQTLYLRDDKFRDPLDEAIRLTFRGNNLLFVGSGMGEDDILRPLRNFMSEASGPPQPASVALLPLRGNDPATSIEEKIFLLRRYGVYALHWGTGKTSVTPTKARPLLPALRALVAATRQALTALPADVSASNQWKAALRDAANAGLLLNPDNPVLADLIEAEELTDAGHAAIPYVKLPDVFQQEWAALGAALRAADMFLRSPATAPNSDVIAARIVIAEIEDALMSSFLMAAVLRLVKHWDVWKRDWFSDIAARPAEPNYERLDIFEGPETYPRKWISSNFKLARRRALALYNDAATPSIAAASGAGAPSTDRLYRCRWSQTYSDFLSALREGAETKQIAREGRRTFFLAGRRGLGKGHFFSALTDQWSFLDYATAAGSADLFYGLYAFNLSFSVEVGSGFDILATFLFDRICQIYIDQLPHSHSGQIQALTEQFKHFRARAPGGSGDRVGALRFLFEVMAGAAVVPAPFPESQVSSKRVKLEKPCGRIVIAVNATHLLFNPRGYAKSSDVVRMLEILFDPAFTTANLDIIFVSSETGLPIDIRFPQDRSIDDPSRNLAGGERGVQPVEVVHLPAVNRNALEVQDDRIAISDLRIRLRPPAAAKDAAVYFHRLQPPRISVVIMSAFPRLALILARQTDTLRETQFDNGKLAEFTFKSRFDDPGTLGEKTRISRYAAASAIAEVIPKVMSAPPVFNDSKDRADWVDALAPKIDQAFSRFYKAAGRNRFCITILCAAVDDVLDTGGTHEDAENALQSLTSAVSGLAEQSREDAVLREVMEHYRRRSNRVIPPQAPLVGLLQQRVQDLKPTLAADAPPLTEVMANLITRPGFWLKFEGLQGEVLADLAVIGVPIEADCLTWLNYGALEEMNSDEKVWLRDDAGRTLLVDLALECLVHRGLAFRFVPRSSSSAPAKFRFGVHRLVQRHGLRRMHEPRLELPQVDNYMPTLYASQPNDMPYPTASAQERIRELVARLSLYPTARYWKSGEIPALDANRQSRMLRAAYSILRSVYSIASVARFSAYAAVDGLPRNGFFEDHRHNVRWVLHRAKTLQKDPAFASEADAAQHLPFLNGDIVWLYNECGALSLLQGSLHDAAKLFAVGLKCVQSIEAPTIGGALTNALRLNRALVDIEMGKLRKADAVLQDIALKSTETRSVRWIARGYRGLVAHIRGDSKLADESYAAAINALRAMKRYRAASIFACHCADLYRSSEPGRVGDAIHMAEDAVKFASTGNHEDLYQIARLTRLRTELHAKRLEVSALRGREIGAARKTLDSIENYARMMGMPRLLIETGQLDAVFRTEIGDLHYASRSLTRALALASDHGMILKKVSLAILLANTYLMRNMDREARLIADAARRLAIQCEYSKAQDEAQQVLTGSSLRFEVPLAGI